MNRTLLGLHLNVDIHACRHLQSLERIHRLLGRCDDINEPLVGPLLELLSGILVLVYSSQDGHYLFLGRKGHRAAHLRTGLLHSLDDLLGRCVHKLMLIRLQGNPHYLIFHKKSRLLFALYILKYDKR